MFPNNQLIYKHNKGCTLEFLCKYKLYRNSCAHSLYLTTLVRAKTDSMIFVKKGALGHDYLKTKSN